MDLDEFARLKSRIERLQRDADRAAGAVEQLLVDLRAESGCEDEAGAARLAAELEEKAERIEARCEAEMAKFEAEFGDRLMEKR